MSLLSGVNYWSISAHTKIGLGIGSGSLGWHERGMPSPNLRERGGIQNFILQRRPILVRLGFCSWILWAWGVTRGRKNRVLIG